jgi:hypothetical protein
MKGKVLAIITAFLFGATFVAAPIVIAAGSDTTGAAGMEEKAPAKTKKAKTKKAKTKKAKKPAVKKATKKKTSKKAKTPKAPAEEMQ